MYSNKVNGHVASPSESLTSSIDYFTVSTATDLTATVANGVSALDKLIEVVSLRGQPVILGTVTGSGPYVLKFATEHKGSWNVTGNALVDNSAVDLKAAIAQHAVGVIDAANTTVTLSANL